LDFLSDRLHLQKKGVVYVKGRNHPKKFWR